MHLCILQAKLRKKIRVTHLLHNSMAVKSVIKMLNSIKDLNAVENSDPTSSGGLETAELQKVSEVMTRVTAMEGDLNHLQPWRASGGGEQWRSRPI